MIFQMVPHWLKQIILEHDNTYSIWKKNTTILATASNDIMSLIENGTIADLLTDVKDNDYDDYFMILEMKSIQIIIILI